MEVGCAYEIDLDDATKDTCDKVCPSCS
jgi:hypothetical protein